MHATSDAVPVADRSGIDKCWNRIGVRGDSSCPELPKHGRCLNCPTYTTSARALLDREPSAGYLAEWTRHFAQSAARTIVSVQDGKAARPGVRSVIIFRVGTEWLALPTAVFAEIAEPRQIHSLPYRRDGTLLGIVNVRGELLICFSLAKLLDHDAAPASQHTSGTAARQRLLVVGRDDRRVAFPVDEVHGVHRYSTHELSEPPATVAKASSTYTLAMLTWRDGTVGYLDGALLLTGLDRSLV
jgi:chemotaxis-related protein WspD